jgi:hypothetical protein
MANISSGDGVAKTVETSTKAVEQSSASSSASDRPDAKFSDLAEKPIERVIDIAKEKAADPKSIRDAETPVAKGRMGHAIQILTNSLSTSLMNITSLEDFEDNYADDNKYRDRLENNFGLRKGPMECLIGTLANITEFREFLEEAHHARNPTAGSGYLSALGQNTTKEGVEGVAASNAVALVGVPKHYETALRPGIGAGELVGFSLPIFALSSSFQQRATYSGQDFHGSENSLSPQAIRHYGVT